MPFAKGESGNRAGRPPGARHKATLAAEALLDGESEGLTRKAVDAALVDTVETRGAARLDEDEARPCEQLQMVRHRRLPDIDGCHNLPVRPHRQAVRLEPSVAVLEAADTAAAAMDDQFSLHVVVDTNGSESHAIQLEKAIAVVQGCKSAIGVAAVVHDQRNKTRLDKLWDAVQHEYWAELCPSPNTSRGRFIT